MFRRYINPKGVDTKIRHSEQNMNVVTLADMQKDYEYKRENLHALGVTCIF